MITKEELDRLAQKYETEDFIKDDPVQFIHRFKKKEDAELGGFIASLFAYGNRKQHTSGFTAAGHPARSGRDIAADT